MPNFANLKPVSTQPNFSALKPVSSPSPDSFHSLSIGANLNSEIQQNKANAFNDLGGSLGGYFGKVGSAFMGGIRQGAQGLTELLGDTNQAQGQVDYAHLLSGAASAFASPVAPLFNAAMDISGANTAIKETADAASNLPVVQQFANSPTGIATAQGADIASSYGNVTGTMAGAEAFPEQLSKLKASVAAPMKAAPDTFSSMAQQVKNSVAGTPESHVASTQADWQRPAEAPGNTFAKARDQLAQAPDTPAFLAQQGLDPQQHIESGYYRTEATAQSLHDTANTMSSETLRPSLKAADYSTPKTSVSDAEKTAIDNINTTKGITEINRQAQIDAATKEFAGLKARFPDGMSLVDMHDAKISNANAGYPKGLDTISDTNTKTASRQIAGVFQKLVETKGEAAGVPVGDFNQYLAKYHKAANYLDALDGKKAPISLKQKIARVAARGVGAVVGAHFGGLPTEFAGYSIGGALEHAVENMPNPVRTAFLSNLEKTNPEAFNKVVSYLQDANLGNTGVPKLPPGSFVAPPVPSEEAQMRSRAIFLTKTPNK